jgi:hypothetical protein
VLSPRRRAAKPPNPGLCAHQVGIALATIAAIAIASLASADAGGYSVLITNAGGGITSSVAPLVVVDHASLSVLSATP